MVYRFTMISDEADDFLREIQIDSDATFFDLHSAILQSTGYNAEQMTSFFTCDDDWEKEQEITLEEMDSSSDEDSYVMRETRLGELLEDEKQKMIYVFDPLAERVFFIELSEIIIGKELKEAACTRKEGKAPQQVLDFDDIMATQTNNLDLDENFYGDKEFDLEDFDPEGFDMDGGSSNIDDYADKY